MRIIETNICVGLGDLIWIKGILDPYKDRFHQIKISYDSRVISIFRQNDHKYMSFLNDIGNLFFSTPPYMLVNGNYKCRGLIELCNDFQLQLVKPNVKDILYKGNLLNLNEEYIVITTKLRSFPMVLWKNLAPQFWDMMRVLCRRYKIVVLGEKQVEMSREYKSIGAENVYSIYDQIIANIPSDRMLDLTIPALGITAPNLQRIQQDTVIMAEAKFVITLSIGGSFCLSVATSNVIGFRADTDGLADLLFNNRTYPDAFITKDWTLFIKRLEQYK